MKFEHKRIQVEARGEALSPGRSVRRVQSVVHSLGSCKAIGRWNNHRNHHHHQPMNSTNILINAHEQYSQRLASALLQMQSSRSQLLSDVRRLKQQTRVDAASPEVQMWFSQFESTRSLQEVASMLIGLMEHGVPVAEFAQAYALAPSTDLPAVFETVQRLRDDESGECPHSSNPRTKGPAPKSCGSSPNAWTNDRARSRCLETIAQGNSRELWWQREESNLVALW